MESSADNSPLIVIVGPTASGKTALAIQIAEQHNGEIITADSRTIYRRLDIGTAKPSRIELERVPHYGINVVEPNERFTAADFKELAQIAITDISDRGKLPILVGGTGLYVDSVLFNFTFLPPGELAERQRLQQYTVEDLQRLLQERGLPLPSNERNPRHLIRRLETGDIPAVSKPLRPNTLVICLDVDLEILKQRIEARVDAMLAAGLVGEAMILGKHYGWEAQALQTIGYREFNKYAQGDQTLAETRDMIIRDTISYAKRQRTWFRRNKSIHWVTDQEKIEDLITTFLSK